MRYALAIVALVSVASGCTRNATWLPSSDANLNKPAHFFAQDAASRFPYPAGLPRGGEYQAGAEIGYDANVVNLVQFSGQTLANVDLWVNRGYVIHLPTLESGRAKLIPFKVIYNDQGKFLPESGVYVDTLEMVVDGTIYDVPHRVGG